ncbi:MAG: hypothetical protein GW809_08320 [Bacteroidetes bacterium]|nr:hypothetical protein [Bacteroidota bacterium]
MGEVVNSRSVHLINFCGGGQVIALKSATALILDRWATFKSPLHKQHIWFLPTHKANAKKPKDLALSHSTKKKYFRIQNIFIYLLNIGKFKNDKYNNGNIW